MSDNRFEQSRAAGGAHHLLGQMVGNWAGITRTWFEPGKLADESPWQASLRLELGGRFLVHQYEGTIQGKPLSGRATYGYSLERQKFQAAWVDSFHMGSAIMCAEGERTADGFWVLGQYDVPGGVPWGWRTVVSLRKADELVVAMYNISPEGQEDIGVETVYRRVG